MQTEMKRYDWTYDGMEADEDGGYVSADAHNTECKRLTEGWHNANKRILELELFVSSISKQKPGKPDYWSECSQCSDNIDNAEELME